MMIRSRIRSTTWLGFALLATGPACSDPSDDIPECHGAVEMSVTPGSAPVFSWTPECRIGYLVVEDRGDGTGYWSVFSPPGQNVIPPPVTYMVVPSGTTEEGPSIPLDSGGAYRVRAFLMDQDQNGQITVEQIGEQAFNQ